MKLKITGEFNELKKVVVCWGTHVPEYETYKTDDLEFNKFHHGSWNKDLLLKQQELFFKKLEKYNVELLFPKTDKDFPWQMYTRDVGFVIKSKFYYAEDRALKDRNGEIDLLLELLSLTADDIVKLSGKIEGGDILVLNEDQVYVGISSRTNQEAIKMLSDRIKTRTFLLGKSVMHLDTRLNLLPNHIALIYPEAFSRLDLRYLQDKYRLIPVSGDEAIKLGTNILIVNPETVFIPTQHQRIARIISDYGLNTELVDYSEPIALGGSFRCTTLPLVRE
jgi:N-dimethylarginine dimethylaminohydrolase